MNLTDAEILELGGLCQALEDGRLTELQRVRLERWLASSEEARRFYVRAMALSSSLMDYAGEMQAEAPDQAPAKRRVVQPPAWVWLAGALAAAAAVTLAFWPRSETPQAKSTPLASTAQESDESIARLSGTKDTHWTGAALRTGDELHKGQRLELASGFAEITFDCGAQVTLEGPASLDVSSAWEAALQRGTLKASVPSEAIGFRVSNPNVSVVDLGTQFSMVTDETGAAEVFVLQGSVEAAARDDHGEELTPVILHEKQAQRFAKAGGGEVRNPEAKLERLMRKVALERFDRPANYVHWSFDETNGHLAAANVAGFDAHIIPATEETLLTEGRHQKALRLDGQHFARAAFPGISRKAARTAAFWINVPNDAAIPDAGTMLAWPFGGNRRSVAIGWNRNPAFGPLGALRTEAGRGSLVGSTPLRDGRWHHVAVVFSPKGKPGREDAGLQLRQYVDGRLESASAKRFGKRAKGNETEAASADDALFIGSGVAGEKSEHFHGLIDELFVADAALTPQEIRYLQRENKPATLKMLAAE